MLKQLTTSVTLLAAFGVLGTCLAPKLSAAELDPAHVPADAKWVVHADLDAFHQTALADRLRQLSLGMAKRAEGWLQDRYGINPRKDLHGVTMFGQGYRTDTGIMILQADFDPEKVKEQIRKGPTVKTTQWNGHTLYTVKLDHKEKKDHQQKGHKEKKEHGQQSEGNRRATGDDHKPEPEDPARNDRTMTIVLVDDNTVVFSSFPENAQTALKLLAGDAPSLKDSDSALLSERKPGVFFYGAAIDLQKINEHRAAMPVLQQHQQIVWSFGQRDNQLFEEATLTAQSAEVAEQMEQALRGLIAFERLWAAGSQPMQDVLDDVEITRDGTEVMVQWHGQTPTVIAAVGDFAQRMQTWKRYFDR